MIENNNSNINEPNSETAGQAGTGGDASREVDEAFAAESARGENSQFETGRANPGASGAAGGGSDSDLQARLHDAEQRALRAQADLENYRKRVRREMEDLQRYAIIPLVRDLLPAVDNLERAMSSVTPDEPAAQLLEGVRMVSDQLVDVLQRHHCRQIEAEGQEFDPSWHEAISEMPSSEHPPGTVIEVPQVGYRVLDRVVRPAQVVVARSES